MSKRIVGMGLAALLAAAGFSAVQGLQHAAAAPTTRAARLIKPWNELKTSEDQIAKIKAIHENSLEEIHKIEAKEKADCMEILTDAQKKELETVIAADKKEAAERRIERKHAATTQPTVTPSK